MPATCLRFQQGVFFQVNASSKCFCLFTLINNQGHHNINLPKLRVLFIWKYLPPGSYCSCTGSSAAPPLINQVVKKLFSLSRLLIKSWSYQSTFINKIFFSLTTIWRNPRIPTINILKLLSTNSNNTSWQRCYTLIKKANCPTQSYDTLSHLADLKSCDMQNCFQSAYTFPDPKKYSAMRFTLKSICCSVWQWDFWGTK